MKPDEQHQSQSGGRRPYSSLNRRPHHAPHREAATNLIRQKIDNLYGDSPVASPKEPQPATQPVNSNPYLRHHNPHPLPQEDEWKAYHSAWQNYYQKYYESYYTTQLAQTTPAKNQAASDSHSYFSDAPPEPTESLSKEEALHTLRQRLLSRVRQSTQKVRKSRHFIPIVSAAVVVLVFAFIQYNSLFIASVAAYISPGSIDPQNIVLNPNENVAVSKEPRLIIPKINVDVPVNYDVGNDYSSQMEAMKTGVAHFAIPGASSHPGEIGNTVLSGHSSNDLFDTGDYKFIFAQVEKLQKGDTIYANYKGTRYTYVVTKKQVVRPTEVSALVYDTDKPVLTLVTCTPLGTALNRLLVTAEQVSPDPTEATEAPQVPSGSNSDSELPGNAPTLFERLFGAN